MHTGFFFLVLVSVIIAVIFQRDGVRRDSSNGAIGGVCAGLGARYNISVPAVRILTFLLAISGLGILPYIILWIILPRD
jgi:phage shock protein PspC (stress-responsive transcriptional regulator)